MINVKRNYLSKDSIINKIISSFFTFSKPGPGTIEHDENDGHTEWHFEFEAYPPVDEDQVKWIVKNENTNRKMKLSLGDSTPDNIFTTKPKIEKTSSFGEPTKHKVTLQIQPQNDESGDSNFDVKFVIKVIKFGNFIISQKIILVTIIISVFIFQCQLHFKITFNVGRKGAQRKRKDFYS